MYVDVPTISLMSDQFVVKLKEYQSAVASPLVQFSVLLCLPVIYQHRSMQESPLM